MLKTRQDWSLDARLSQAELKVKESPETILILSSNSNWENNSQRSSVGVIITVSICHSAAGLGVLVGLTGTLLYRVEVTVMGSDLWLACSSLALYTALCTLDRPHTGNKDRRWSTTGLLDWLSSRESYQNFLFSYFSTSIIMRMWYFYKYLATSRTISH